MNNKVTLLIILTGMAALPLSAQKRMSLAECLRQATDSNLTLRSGKTAVIRAKEAQGTAFDIGKTGVSLAQTPTTGGGPENALTFSQQFEFPTVYGARHSKMKAETRLEEMRVEVSRNELERNVASTYYSLLYAMEMKRALDRQDSVYRKFLDIAEKRLKAGESGRLEMINARQLLEDNHIAIGNSERLIANLQLELCRWMNTRSAVLPIEDGLPIRAIPLGQAHGFDPENTPAVRLAGQEKAVAEKSLRLARQAFLPDISLAASTQMLLKGFNPYNIERARFAQGNFMGFEVGISVPLFFGGKRAGVRAAKRDLERNELLLEQERQNAAASYSKAKNDFSNALQRLDYYRDSGCKDAAELARLAQVSYEKGDIGYVEYMQSLQTAFSRQAAYIAAVDEYNQSLITLEYIQSNNK